MKEKAEGYLLRQPIIDRHHHIVGYELLFRHPDQLADEANPSDLIACTTCINTMAQALYSQGEYWQLKNKLIFIEMDETMLESDFPALLPADKVVIKLLKTVQASPNLTSRMQSLHQLGFRFALGVNALLPEYEPLLPLTSYIKLDIKGLSPERVTAIVNDAKRRPVKLIAEQIDEFSTFKQIEGIRFDFFQGYYCTRPERYATKSINPSQAIVLDLMNKVRADADIGQIESIFKRDVALSFKLLRYLNSASLGLTCEVQSIRHAVNILGMKPLYRWLNLLLATASSKPTASALTRIAITRGRLCELLGHHHLTREEPDNLFITGVFSLLDAIMEMPMADILNHITLPDNVLDALNGYSGSYGPILELAIATEGREARQIGGLAESLLLNSEQVNTASLQALSWVEALGLDE